MSKRKRWIIAAGAALAAGVLSVRWVVFSDHLLPLASRVAGQRGEYALSAPLPIHRTEAGGVVCKGKFYLAGGIDGLARTLTSFMSYDPATDSWEALPDLPEPVNHPGVVSDGTNVYIVGGFNPLGIRVHGFMFADWRPRTRVFVFHPQERRWTMGPSLPEPRGAGGVAYLEGAIWYAGDINQDKAICTDFFRLDLAAGTWTRMPPMQIARDHLRMEALEGKLYAVSGRKDDLRWNLPVLECYDPRTNAWSRKADIPVGRGGFGTATLNGFLYAFGGEYIWTCLNNVERYDPSSDRWEQWDSLPEGRHGICAGVIGGRIHLISGGRHPRISISGIHRVYTPH